jgi:hypothetical protein
VKKHGVLAYEGMPIEEEERNGEFGYPQPNERDRQSAQ